MPFKRKVIKLSIAAGALFIVYVLSFVLSTENRVRRSSLWTPLNAKTAAKAVSIEIEGSEKIMLEKNGDSWNVRADEVLYPAKQTRIEDLFAALGKKAEYPLRGITQANWKKVNVDSDNAEKIIIRDGGAGTTELYFGQNDATGKEIYIRSGEQVRSGQDIFSGYFNSDRKSWYELALFPKHDEQGLSLEAVQRVTVTTPPQDGEAAGESYTLLRKENGWQFESGEDADKSQVDSTVRYILDASAEDFVEPARVENDIFGGARGSVLLETGSTLRSTLEAGPKINERITVKTSSLDHVYTLSDWAASRIWRSKADLVSKPE